MNRLNVAYCSECADLVEFSLHAERIIEDYKGVKINYDFNVARCKYCHNEVAASLDYNYDKSLSRIKAFKKAKGIIDENGISEIMEKYNVGKEPLSIIAGFGKVTIKRYFEGVIPASEYSNKLKRLLNDEAFFAESFEANISKLNDTTIKKIRKRLEDLHEIKESKINQIVNYIIIRVGEVTPLALEKLLAFAVGVNYALNRTSLIDDECQAWQHGYVFPNIYYKYKKDGYKPIDSGIRSTHGVMLSKLNENEIKAIDLVVSTFGLYSPRTLEFISHNQAPWIEKRNGYRDNEPSTDAINYESMKDYYIKNNLYSKENIDRYINELLLTVAEKQ